MIALFLLNGGAFAESGISFRLQGNCMYVSGGDVNPGTQAWFDYREGNWPVSRGGYRAVHSGYEFGGDIIFNLSSRLGVGIGGGYMQISRASAMSLYFTEPSLNQGGASAEPKLSAFPVRVGAYLTLPLSGKLNFIADGGLSYYLKVRYRDELEGVIWAGDILTYYTFISTRAGAKGASIGFQGGLGLEYELLHNLFLSLSARGSYARFRSWEGSSDYEIYEFGEAITSLSEQGKLYYESVPILTYEPRLLVVQESPPNGPGGEPRQAALDFSGFSLQLGIRIRL